MFIAGKIKNTGKQIQKKNHSSDSWGETFGYGALFIKEFLLNK